MSRPVAVELGALRRELERLRRRLGRGASQYLAGGQLEPFVYFHDGTWIDEAAPNTARYPTQNSTRHGEPGVKQDWSDGAGGGAAREVWLRLPHGVRLPAGRAATFCIFFEEVYADAGGCGNQDQLDVTLGLVTAAFSQATLEAMTWNNRPASDAGHLLGQLLVDPATDDWWQNEPETPAGRCAALSVRVTPAAALALTGVRVWLPAQDAYTDATGAATLMHTRLGQPHRSFVLLE